MKAKQNESDANHNDPNGSPRTVVDAIMSQPSAIISRELLMRECSVSAMKQALQQSRKAETLVRSHIASKGRRIFKKYNPDYAFDYKVVEDVHGEVFQEENHTGVLAAVFSGLTIFISCLGLFALAAYMAENRIKEIGIRKVMGASVSGIATLLSKDFLKLVLISFVIASPLAGWFMHTWLQNFSYHIRISWWIFALTGLLTVLITLVTVSSQAIRAALTNPADSLRTE